MFSTARIKVRNPICTQSHKGSSKESNECSNCDKPLEKMDNIFLRTGNFRMLDAIAWNTLNKAAGVPREFTLYRCSTCGKVEFYEPDAANQ